MSKKQTAAERKEPVTMAQMIAKMMDDPCESDPSVTWRQALSRRVFRKALIGDMKALAWLYAVSGEGAREDARKHAEQEQEKLSRAAERQRKIDSGEPLTWHEEIEAMEDRLGGGSRN